VENIPVSSCARPDMAETIKSKSSSEQTEVYGLMVAKPGADSLVFMPLLIIINLYLYKLRALQSDQPKKMLDRKLTFQELEATKNNSNRTTFGFSIWLHDIRSVHNVGSVFRSCDGAGADKIYLSGYTPHPPREDISKTALGAEKSVEFEYQAEARLVSESIRRAGMKIFAVELTHAAKPYTELDAEDLSSVFVFGNELSGLPQDVLDLCDGAVVLPMNGIKHSLNVSVAAGIIAYRLAHIAQSV